MCDLTCFIQVRPFIIKRFSLIFIKEEKMKQFLKNLALIALILAIASPVFAKSKKMKVNKDGTVDVEVWYGAAVTEAGPPPADWAAYKIIREKLGINLLLTALPSNESDQDTKINAAGAANALPDLFMVSSKTYPILIKQGLLSAVDDMYPMMPNRTKLLYDRDSQNFSKVNGKSYALAQPGSIIKNEGVLIRKDWLDKLGLKVPTTTDEFLEVMKAFTFKDPDGNGKDDTYGFGAFLELRPTNEGLGTRFDPFFGAYGVAGTWNLTAGAPGLNVRKPEYYDAMVFAKKIIDAKVIDPNWLAYKKDDFRAAWKQGKFGIMREQNAAYASESNYAPFDKNFPNASWIIVDPPKGPAGLESCGTYSQAYRMYAVSSGADKQSVKINGKIVTKKQLISRVLEWMSDESANGGYYLLGWGQKGVNYVLDASGSPTADGVPDPKKAFSKADQQPLTQLRNMVFYNGDIELASRYPSYITAVSKKHMSALEALRQMQSKPWTPCNGQDVMPLPDADLTRFYEQGVVEFMTGKRQLTKENWTSWVADFDKMGGKAWNDAGVAAAKAGGYLNN
jgi:putative aldouronate transport system substrate-binding protein